LRIEWSQLSETVEELERSEYMASDKRIAAKERMRAQNQCAIDQLLAHGAEPLNVTTFRCECGQRRCISSIAMSVSEYVAMHAPLGRYTLKPGHELPDVVAIRNKVL